MGEYWWILVGEISRIGAVRELFEENGISVKEDELVLLGTNKGETEFWDIYIVRKDTPLSALKMQESYIHSDE